MITATTRHDDEKIGVIQGIKPDSIIEWRVAVGLWKLGWEFDYQEQTRPGQRNLGVVVIDFLVHTTPKWTPLFVDGEYWHGSAQNREDDAYKRTLLDSSNRNRWFPHIALAEKDLQSQGEADAILKQHFGSNR